MLRRLTFESGQASQDGYACKNWFLAHNIAMSFNPNSSPPGQPPSPEGIEPIEIKGYVTEIDPESGAFTGRFEHSDGGLWEATFNRDEFQPEELALLAEGATFTWIAVPEPPAKDCSVMDRIDGNITVTPIAESRIVFDPPVVINQGVIDEALAKARARRATRPDDRPL
jgi:hypothetical protein